MRLFPVLLLMLSTCFSATFSISLSSPFTTDPTPTPEVSAPATFTPVAYIGNVTPLSQTINVRGCPATSCPVVALLRLGERLPVLMTGDEWYQVEVSGQAAAWIAKQVVRFEAR